MSWYEDDDELDDDAEQALAVDLHGLRPEQALRRLAQELHAARVRGIDRMLVITGRGWGNRTRTPVLRHRVEAWLGGPEGKACRVASVTVVAKGGALDVRLAP